jgi:hypothetical protein
MTEEIAWRQGIGCGFIIGLTVGVLLIFLILRVKL